MVLNQGPTGAIRTMALSQRTKTSIAYNSVAAINGSVTGAITKQVCDPGPFKRGRTVVQVTSAATAAAARGEGMKRSAAAGAAVLTAKAAAVGTAATAAAPVVLGVTAVCALGYGVYRLFRK